MVGKSRVSERKLVASEVSQVGPRSYFWLPLLSRRVVVCFDFVWPGEVLVGEPDFRLTFVLVTLGTPGRGPTSFFFLWT
jgi:hypothetical protein